MKKSVLPISTCYRPITVHNNVYGDIKVPCGHCPNCESKQRSLWSSRLSDEVSSYHKDCVVFFTLTYSNEHLPLLYLDSDYIPFDLKRGNGENLLHISSSENYIRKLANDYTRLQMQTETIPYGYKCKRQKELKEHYLTELKKYEISKIDPIFKNTWDSAVEASQTLKQPLYGMKSFVESVSHRVITYDSFNSDNGTGYNVKKDSVPFYDFKTQHQYRFAISYKRDIQLFLMRLRKHMFDHGMVEDGASSFRYFIVSEYGPTTLRPHYHGLLMFNSPLYAKYFASKLLLEIWGKCDVNVISENDMPQLVNGNAASYVAKYVSRTSELPPLLRIKPFAPFHLQSNSIGCAEFDMSNVKSIVYDSDLQKNVVRRSDDGAFYTMLQPYRDSSWNRVFPRFLNERHVSETNLLKLVTTLSKIDYIDDIPNLTSEFRSRFQDKRILLVSKHDFQPKDMLTYKYKESPTLPSNNDCFHYPLTSDDLFRKYSYIQDSNMYWFGVPINRTAVIKIWKYIHDYNITPSEYILLRKLYFSKRFTLNLKNQYEKSTHYSLADFLRYHYSELYEKLPSDYNSLIDGFLNGDSSCVTFINLLHYYDIDPIDYSSSHGILLDILQENDSIFVGYTKELQSKISKFEKKRKNYSQLYLTTT